MHCFEHSAWAGLDLGDGILHFQSVQRFASDAWGAYFRRILPRPEDAPVAIETVNITASRAVLADLAQGLAVTVAGLPLRLTDARDRAALADALALLDAQTPEDTMHGHETDAYDPTPAEQQRLDEDADAYLRQWREETDPNA